MSALPAVIQSNGLEAVLGLALNTVGSGTKRHYARALVEYIDWQARQGAAFNRASVYQWRSELEASGLSPSTINIKLSALRKLAWEASHCGVLDDAVAAGISQVPNVAERGQRMGNWLTQKQAQRLIEAPDPLTFKGTRDRAALALLVGCALRREEAAQLTMEHIQQREGRWAIVDMRGKGGRIRTIAVPGWVKVAIDRWTEAASITTGRILRAVNRHGQIIPDSISGNAVFELAGQYGAEIGVELRPHDLRRTCAKLCRKHGGQLEQIQLLLGHASIETTQTYLGTTLDLEQPPNDKLGLKWRDES